MKTPGFILRLLTPLSYFLPFVFFLPTCTDMVTLEKAYNKSEAFKNEEKKNASELSSLEALLDSIRQTNSSEALEEFRARARHYVPTSQHLKYLDQDLHYYLIMPTASSLSGIGTLYFHKNLLGKTTMAISLGLSFLTLILWPLIDRKRLGTSIVLVNTLTLCIFMIDCVLTEVSVLYGTWILLFLLIAQLVTREKKPETAHR
jgi:hypothetical protein